MSDAQVAKASNGAQPVRTEIQEFIQPLLTSLDGTKKAGMVRIVRCEDAVLRHELMTALRGQLKQRRPVIVHSERCTGATDAWAALAEAVAGEQEAPRRTFLGRLRDALFERLSARERLSAALEDDSSTDERVDAVVEYLGAQRQRALSIIVHDAPYADTAARRALAEAVPRLCQRLGATAMVVTGAMPADEDDQVGDRFEDLARVDDFSTLSRGAFRSWVRSKFAEQKVAMTVDGVEWDAIVAEQTYPRLTRADDAVQRMEHHLERARQRRGWFETLREDEQFDSRVMFLSLVGSLFPTFLNFLEYESVAPEQLLLRFQLWILEAEGSGPIHDDAETTFLNDSDLAELFESCLLNDSIRFRDAEQVAAYLAVVTGLRNQDNDDEARPTNPRKTWAFLAWLRRENPGDWKKEVTKPDGTDQSEGQQLFSEFDLMRTRLEQAKTAQSHREYTTADRLLAAALRTVRRRRNEEHVFQCLLDLSTNYRLWALADRETLQKRAKAANHLREARDIAQRRRDPIGLVRALVLSGELQRDLGCVTDAVANWQDAAEEAQKHPDLASQLLAFEALGRGMLLVKGKRDEAISWLKQARDTAIRIGASRQGVRSDDGTRLTELIDLNKPLVFVSYSSKDRDLVTLVSGRLEELERQNKIRLFIDTRITPGTPWLSEIGRRIDEAAIVLLLISENFLNIGSSFTAQYELGRIEESLQRPGYRSPNPLQCLMVKSAQITNQFFSDRHFVGKKVGQVVALEDAHKGVNGEERWLLDQLTDTICTEAQAVQYREA